jgi:hypothetical protein
MTATFSSSMRSPKTVNDSKRGYRTACQHSGIPEHIKQRQLAAKAAKCVS